MNNEIKEILEYYKKDAEKFEYLMKDYTEEQLKTTFSRSYQRYRNHKLLLDYITNLQQEKEDYKSRCEKAIEYIKNDYVIIQQEMNEGRGFDGAQQSYRIYVKDYLLNILQNGSDEE